MTIIKTCKIWVDMLPDIDLDVYGLYVTMDTKVIKQLNTRNLNAIYGTMVASLLYY